MVEDVNIVVKKGGQTSTVLTLFARGAGCSVYADVFQNGGAGWPVQMFRFQPY